MHKLEFVGVFFDLLVPYGVGVNCFNQGALVNMFYEFCTLITGFNFHFPVLYCANEIIQLASHPIGTAYQTTAIPNRGARTIARDTRIIRLTRLATVNIVISPAPRNNPSTAILKPIRQNDHPINIR